jgi:hypothetical protein
MEILVEGVKILSKEEIVDYAQPNSMIYIAAVLIVFVITLIMMNMDFKGYHVVSVLFFFLGICSITVLYKGAQNTTEPTGKYSYVVELSEGVDITELYKKYEVEKSEEISGKTILNIKEK